MFYRKCLKVDLKKVIRNELQSLHVPGTTVIVLKDLKTLKALINDKFFSESNSVKYPNITTTKSNLFQGSRKYACLCRTNPRPITLSIISVV